MSRTRTKQKPVTADDLHDWLAVAEYALERTGSTAFLREARRRVVEDLRARYHAAMLEEA